MSEASITTGPLNAVAFDPDDLSRLDSGDMEKLAMETFAKLRHSMTAEQVRVFEEMLDRVSMPSTYCSCGYDY
jgi:hypothetical protein